MGYRLIDKSGNFPSAGSVPLTRREARRAALRIGKDWQRRGVAVNIEIHGPSGHVEYIDDMWCSWTPLTREQKSLLRKCGVRI